MSINKYFTLIKDEDQLDKDFEKELKDNPQAITQETAKFFNEKMRIELDYFRCRRLARLLFFLLEMVELERKKNAELHGILDQHRHPGAATEEYKP